LLAGIANTTFAWLACASFLYRS